MNMIGHHYPGMDFHSVFPGIFFEPIRIGSVIFLGNKACLTIVSALDDMKRYAYGGDSRKSGHCFFSSLEVRGVVSL
jgi:hypothetical protein